ncbi:MAG: DUF167 domain-containing protein [Patescibacteria group bacterium]|nr:DUF167 domain-containing protein [Patescibacteria group bacterium]
MRVTVKVIPRAHKNIVELCDDGTYKVCVTTSPTDGKANIAVQKMLAQCFDVPKSNVCIVRRCNVTDKACEN